MSTQTIGMDDRLYRYIVDSSVSEPAVLARLRCETAALPEAGMQIAPEQGQFMALLAELIGARRALEIGTFTGYSSLWIALTLPSDGRLVACDVSEEWTSIARRYWHEAGVESKIDLRLGPALQTLAKMEQGEEEPFDFAFIDADKQNQDAYYETALRLVRPGGLIAIDNAFRGGNVADLTLADPINELVRTLTRKIRDDARVCSSLVPIGDGLILARKR